MSKYTDIKIRFKQDTAQYKKGDVVSVSEDQAKEIAVRSPDRVEIIQNEKKPGSIFTLRGQAEEFYRRQPYFYDETGVFWLWDSQSEVYKRANRDEKVLNLIHDHTGMDTVSSKNKTEILNSLKQVGHTKIPEEASKKWIKFANGIFDLEQEFLEMRVPTPQHFITNAIPWNLGDSTKTPVMDKLFEEWVGKDHVRTLYEIIAYCLLPNYPMARIFTFVGEGMNGKSCYLNLVRKFLGVDNVTSTDLDRLLKSRFEATRLHKKLACLISETDFSDNDKTGLLKQLTGNDPVPMEYKGKDNFVDVNYAKILISTNNLPETGDKTIGFYRRWLIIDFPNRFDEKKDVLATIPDEEYHNLAAKSVVLLRELLQNREFYNEGNLEQRQKKYEDLSNPLDKFLKEFTVDDIDGYVWKKSFEEKLNDWCKQNRFRTMSDVSIGKKMNGKGFQQAMRHADWMDKDSSQKGRVWLGLVWKD